MKLREQSTLGWQMLPILAVQVLGHHAKQNPELLREPETITVRTPHGDIQVRADLMVKMGRRKGMGAAELSEFYPEPRRNPSPVARDGSGFDEELKGDAPFNKQLPTRTIQALRLR